MATFDDLLNLDTKLVNGGLLPLTLFWRETLERWYEHPTALSLVARVGRGGAKSNTATKVALCETLLGDWPVPPGERHYFAFVSINKDEAAQRIRLLETCLRVLGVPFTRSGDEIALTDLPLGFRVFACQIGAVSGFRCIGFVADELAKWSADDSAADPASEVLSSLGAMSITHEDARSLLVSSAFSLEDEHCKRFNMGNDARQLVAFAESWVANPDAITIEATRLAEPDARKWAREYASIPQSASSSCFDPLDIDAAFAREIPPGYIPESCVMVLDPSSGGADSFTWAGVRIYRDPFEFSKKLIAFGLIDGIPGGFKATGNATNVVRCIVSVGREIGANTAYSDQRESFSLSSLFQSEGMRFVEVPWSNESKTGAVELVRRWLATGTIALLDHDRMRAELMAFQEKLTPSGAITYGARRGGHDDYVALLLTFATAFVKNGLHASFDVRDWSRRQRERDDARPLTMEDHFGLSRRSQRRRTGSVLDRSPEQRAADTFPYAVGRTPRDRNNGGGFSSGGF